MSLGPLAWVSAGVGLGVPLRAVAWTGVASECGEEQLPSVSLWGMMRIQACWQLAPVFQVTAEIRVAVAHLSRVQATGRFRRSWEDERQEPTVCSFWEAEVGSWTAEGCRVWSLRGPAQRIDELEAKGGRAWGSLASMCTDLSPTRPHKTPCGPK